MIQRELATEYMDYLVEVRSGSGIVGENFKVNKASEDSIIVFTPTGFEVKTVQEVGIAGTQRPAT